MMIPLHSMLAISADMTAKLLLAGFAVILLIAFFVGYAQGFRRVGWKGVMCLGAFGLFWLVDMLAKKYAFVLPFVKETAYTPSTTVITTIAISAVAIAVGLLVYGVCTKFLRPQYKWVIHNRVYYVNGLEVEDDSGEVRGELEKRKVLINAGEPSLAGRFLGGFLSAVNILAVLLIFAIALIFTVEYTSLAQDATISALAKQPILAKIVDVIKKYALDYVFICIITMVACNGYDKGFVSSFLALFSTVGGVAVLGLSVYLPFSSHANKMGFLLPLVEKIKGLVGKIPYVGAFETVQKLCASIALCILFLIVFFLAFKLLKFLLNRLEGTIKANDTLKIVDGILSTVTYLIVGIALCFLFGCSLYACDYFKWLEVDFLQDGTLGHGLYEICGKVFVSVWTKIRPFLVA